MKDGDGDSERRNLVQERERILRELADLEDSDDEEEKKPSVAPPPIPEERRFEDESSPTCSSSITRNDTYSRAEVSSSSSNSNSCDTYTNVMSNLYSQQSDNNTMFVLDELSTSQGCPFSKSQEIDEEIEELLENGIDEGVDSKTVSKTVLEKTDHDRFNPLPTDWVMITHLSGMPVYLHKPTRVITLSRPYKMDAPIRNHLIPISSIPCLYRKRLEEKEKTRMEALEKKQKEEEESSTVQKIADQILSGANAGIIENEEDLLLNPEQFNEYCSKVFKFKQIAVKRYDSSEEKPEARKNRRLDNLLNRVGFQGKYEDIKSNTEEHELLITAPSGAVLIDVTPYDHRRRGNKKPFLLNPVGRTTVTVLNEFMQRLVKGKIEYECEDNRSVTCPYKATAWLTMKTAAIINTGGNAKEKLTLMKEQAELTGSNSTAGVETDSKKFPIGRGIGHSKKVARLAAARDALSKLLPSLNVSEEFNCVGVQAKKEDTGESSKGFDEEATDLFDKVNILSKNLTHLCIKFGITKPMSLLKDAVSRSLRWNGMNLETRKDFVGNGGQLSKITLVLGDFEETAEGNGVKAATQIASQMLLAKLHPELTSYGSFLRLYGGIENKAAKDEAKKQHDQVVRLQNQGSLLQPNHAVLEKLKEEMKKVTLIHPPRRFLYGLSSSEVPFKPEITTSIGVQTDFMPRMVHQSQPTLLMPPIYQPTQLIAPPQQHPVPFNMPANVSTMFYPPVAAPPIPPDRKRPFAPEVGEQPSFPSKRPPPFP